MKHFYAQCNSVLKNPYGFWCKKFLFALLAIFCFGTVSAQVILNTSNWSYAQDFNTLANTGTSSALPTGWFFTESGTGANTVYTAGTGSGTSGDTYSFGAASSTERTLGALQSNSTATIIGAAFTNVISTDINSMTFSYTGETWRVGAANRSDRLDFQYSTDATSLTTGTWIDLDAMDYVNPGQAIGSGSMQHSANMTGSLPITLPTGSTIWIRWIDANVSGSDDGMGIDDFNLSYTNVAPPGSADIPQSYAIINFGGSDVYYDLKSSTANPDFNGANLGTFASGGSLWLDGAQNKIEKCGSYDVTANHLLYRIYPTVSPSGSFNSVNLPWLSNDGGGLGCFIQTWQEAGAGINLLNGLCDGNYTVEVYTTADYTGGGGGTVLANNGGANYKANFTIANPVNSGIFESYAVVNGSWYDLQAATGNPDFSGANLGLFNSASGSLIVNGGQNKTYKCPPDDITGGAIYYRIYPQGSPSGSFTPVNFNWASNDPGALCPGGQNQTWQNTGNSTPNLITGLPDGTYSLEVYTQANYNGACGSGIHYSSNSGANYIANFEVGSAPDITNPGTQNAIGSSCVAVVNYNITSTGLAPITYTYSFSFNAVTYDSGSGTGSGATFAVGTTTVTITATNSLGTDVESFDVIVTDNTAPIIFPQDATVYLDAAGNASITAGQVDAGSVDDCGIQSVTVSPTNFNCSNITQPLSDLIISEYVEGSATNKAIEIYNGTGAAVNLQDYALRLFSNGSATASTGIILPNYSLANGDAYIIVNNSGGITTTFDLIAAAVVNFNGDDAIALFKNPATATTGGTTVDIFGSIGQDPGSAWTSGAISTTNQTLRRKASVLAGVTSPSSGFPTLGTEWDNYPIDDVADLGSHIVNGANIVTLTVTDINGNVATATAHVTVLDNLAPSAPTIADATGECSVTVTTPTATDNCAGTVTGTTSDPTTYNTQGSYVVTWTFDDGNGNTSTATQNVIVDDVTAPTAPTIADATGECSVTVTAPTATDNCGGTVTGTTSDPTTYNTQGSYTVTWSFDDGNGNTSTATQNVIVNDVTAPTAPTLADATGECSVSVTAPTATDNCAGIVTGTTSNPTTYNTQGSYTVTWTFDDGNGNTSTATQNVIVDDITAPSAPTLADATGECSVSVTAPTATDNCSGTVTGTTSDPTTYNTQGSYTVTWTFDDGNGNTSTATQNVIVDDVTAPTAPTIADATGECSVSVTAPTATDNCSGTVTGTTSDPTTYNTQGSYVVTWTFNDGNGNTSTATQNVIVDDVTAPTAPTIADATGECSVTVTAPTATDNCSGTVTGTTSDPTTYNTQGSYVVTWSFDDGNGNTSTATQNVIVDDVTAPSAPTIADATGECSVTVTAPTATDNCGGTVTGTTTDPTTYNTQGSYVVTWSFDDGNGNTSTATQNVIVDDVTAPTAPTIADATGECSVSVTAPTATDNCSGTVTGTTSDPTTFSTQGSYVVNWTFNDGNGNTSTATQNVIVDDVTAPSAPTIADATGECSVTVTAPTATDNCAGTVTGTTSDPTTYNTQGSYTVTWTFDDGNGNTSTATQNVIVDDVTAPSAPTIADATGECSVTVTAPTATDNCAGTVTGTTSDPTTYNTQGSYTVTWTFDDGNGNTSTATQNVIVDDVTDPVAPVSLPDVVAECSATLTAPTAPDNCAGTITATTTDPVNYIAQGNYTVTWTFDDGNGNVSSVDQNVIIDDVTAPSAPTLADATGECSVTVTAPTATDNCAGSVTGTTTDPTTYNTQGSYTVTWTFDDGNGNTSTATQNVIVNDVTAPVAPASLPDATGECAVTLNGPVVVDNCGSNITGTAMDPITGIESTTITIIDQGTTIVTWTFTDASGNSSTADQTVIIDDITAPPAPASLPTLTDECSYTVTTFPTVEDECVKTVEGIPTDPGTGTVLSSLTFNTQGIHSIRWVFDDGNGNSSYTDQDIVIQDVTAPVMACPANITLSSSQATATWTDPTATDNCGAVTVTQTAGPASGSTFAPGTTTTITYQATDAAGLSTTCSFTVTRNAGINVNVTYTPINCYGGWSLVHVTASGGYAPYWGVGYFFVPAGTYNFTVWDSHGQNGTTTVTITQPTPIVVACGTNNPELFFGYSADNTAQIVASASGGTPPYKISFSMNRRLYCNVSNSSGDETWVAGANTATNTYTVCPGTGSYWQPPVSTSTATLGEGDTYSLTVSLMEDAVITATITDANGCVQKCTTPIFASDVRCAGNKVKLCHKQGSHGCRTICVDESAVASHLAHGDFLGECNYHCHPHNNNPWWWGPGWGWWGPWWGWWNGWWPWWNGKTNTAAATIETSKAGTIQEEATGIDIFSLKVAPNPSATEFVLQVNSANHTDRMLVNIYDISGKIYKQFKASPSQMIKFGANMRPGTYLVEVLQSGRRKTATVIKL